MIYKLLTRETKLGNDIIIGICMILCGYLYYYENRIRIFITDNPDDINFYIKLIIGILIIFTWMKLSLENGLKHRISFLIFTLCIWIIPQIVNYIIETYIKWQFSNEIISRSLLILRHLSSTINLSLRILGEIIYQYTNIPYIVTLNCLVMCYIIMFVFGFIINKYHNIGENQNVKLIKTPESDSTTT